MRKTLSHITALLLGLLCVAPPEFLQDASRFAIDLGASDPKIKADYILNVPVNSFGWLYAVVASGLLGFFLLSKSIHPAMKFLLAYLFVTAFFSEVPFLSFNAYILITPTAVFFIWMRKCDFKIIISMMEAVFWIEMVLATLHLTGHDTLMNFGRTETIFWGTVLQHMRFASLLCILSPFLLIKSKWYILPICAAAILCTSSGFALSIIAGCVVYAILKNDEKVMRILKYGIVPLLAIAIYLGRDSFAVAFREGRIRVWLVILKSWIFDTKAAIGNPDWMGVSQTGPFNLKSFLFGHGTDTFYNLFAAYKHDANAFAQAHNCWLQLPWEIGLLGFTAFTIYAFWLALRLYQAKEHELLAGWAIMATDMFFHFPTRMTQTIWLMVAYAALCEQRIAAAFDDGRLDKFEWYESLKRKASRWLPTSPTILE